MCRRASLCLIIFSVCSIYLAGFAGGSGTEEDPFLVAEAEHLYNVGSYLGYESADKHFLQTADINLGVSPWDDNDGWTPIGHSTKRFHGTYDGGEHSITGLTIDKNDEIFLGLFGVVYKTATIKNVVLEEVSVLAASYAGGLVGWNQGTIINSRSSGKVRAEARAGGLIGENEGAEITACYSSCEVEGERHLGGLIGYNKGGSIIDSGSSGSVQGEDNLGGLAGVSEDSSVSGSYAKGSIHGEDNIGGLIGLAEKVDIRNSYSAANVKGEDNVGVLVGHSLESSIDLSFSKGVVTGNSNHIGGLVGFNEESSISRSFSSSQVKGTGYFVGGFVGANEGTISNCYSTGSVQGHFFSGGFAGANQEQGSINRCYSTGLVDGTSSNAGFLAFNLFASSSDSYWDIETSGQTESPGATGKTTEQMTYPYSDNTYDGWDFDEIWHNDTDGTVNDGYPYLFREEHVSVDRKAVIEPEAFNLNNFPNPFNPSTTIRFTLPHSSEVAVEIFNIKGQTINKINLGVKRDGKHNFIWDGTDRFGGPVPSRILFYRLQISGKTISTNKMMLLR